MRIVVPAELRHAADIADPSALRDPRLVTFSESTVEIDMRQCRFIRLPGLLWCLTYALVAQKRSNVRVLLPRDAVVRQWVESVGLSRILADAGVDVDPPPSDHVAGNIQVVLPLTCFTNSTDAEAVTARAHDSLTRSGLGTANIQPLVGEVFSELAMNAVQHAESPIAAYGFVQYYEYDDGPQFVCGVADGGIGIRDSLRQNPSLRYVRTDAGAIDKAIQQRVSRMREGNRGMGLTWVKDQVTMPRRGLVVHSVAGRLLLDGNRPSQARFARVFPGTSVCAWIST